MLNTGQKKTSFTKGVLIGVGLLLTYSISAGNCVAAPLEGGTLNPLSIPKYVTPLVFPPVMNNDGAAESYDIAVREFKQQILPGGIWSVASAKCAADPNCTFPATTIWSYGPAADPAPDASALGIDPGIAPAPNSQFNYPAYTFETTSNTGVNVRWINDLVDDSGAPLPHLFSVDQTLHWANPGPTPCSHPGKTKDCTTDDPTPYTGPVPIVTHVHGAHVDPHSDGYPEAWWLPADVDPLLYDSSGTLFDDVTGTNPGNLGYADYFYRQDQPATTLWYHDHALGMTRLNVYAGPAGFWLVRGGAFDGAMDNLTASAAVLPGPAPVANQDVLSLNIPGNPIRSSIREIPIVIQDRSFNDDGSLFYPDNRAFFEGLNPAQLQIPFVPDSDIAPIWNPEAFFNTMVVNGVTWPTLDVAPAKYRFRLLNGTNSRFLNLAMFVVNPDGTNGAEIPFYQIGGDQGFLPNVVEVRTGFMTAIDPAISQKIGMALIKKVALSQRLITILESKLAGTTKPRQIALIQRLIAIVQARITKEQNKAAQKLAQMTIGTPTPGPDPLQALLMGPAERADVIVDFSGLQAGDTVRIFNTGPDHPFNGDWLASVPADPSTTGQVMEFIVTPALLGQAPTDPVMADGTPNPNAATNPLSHAMYAEAANTAPLAATQTLSLNEEESATLCVTVDGAGNVVAVPGEIPPLCGGLGVPMAPKAALLGTFDPTTGTSTPMLWSDPMTERPIMGDTELWEIYNLTADGHPMHLHLVRYQVVNRQLLDPATNLPVGVPLLPEANEIGYKDTVIAYPGEVTRLKATFDVAGLYVWHCHIVEHEDNEMMRPYCVDAAPGVDSCPDVL